MKLTNEEIVLLMKEESDRIERTTSTNKTEKFCEPICAFANDLPNHQLPGYLFVGVHDNGELSGLKVSDELLRNLTACRLNGNVQPLPKIDVQKYTFEKGDVAVVEVFPSDMPPVRYKGRIYIRIGPRRGIASEQEERILTERRIARGKTFDVQPCMGCGLDVLALDLFLVTYRPLVLDQTILEENHREPKEQLSSLRFYDVQYNCVTHAGLLLFGKNPRAYIPGAYIQFVRYNGTSLADEVIDQKEFSGDLITLLRNLDGFLPIQIRISMRSVSTLREETEQEYPREALRELLVNAIMHRDYASNAPIRFYWFSDRIEIQNPGGLYGAARPENFPRQNDYRNPVLAEAMKALGYINKFGRGIARATEALEKNGNPPPEFDFKEQTYFLVTIKGKE